MTLVRSSPSGPLVEAEMPPIDPVTVLGNPEDEEAEPVGMSVSDMLDLLTDDDIGWLFDGSSNAYVSAGNVLNKERNQAFTMSIWLRTRAPGATQMLISKMGPATAQRGYNMQLAPFGYNYRLNNNINAGANSIALGNVTIEPDFSFHNIIMTYDGSSLAAGVHMYYDNAEIAFTILNNTLSATTVNTNDLAIGARPIDGLAPFNGQLSNASIWGKALSVAEVDEVYNDGAPGDLLATTMASFLEWWIKLDQDDSLGPGGFIDYSPNGFDATAAAGVSLDENIGSLVQRLDDGWAIINPDELLFPAFQRAPDMAKFWVVAGITGNISAGFNIASVSDTGTGIIGVNFGTPFATANYCALVCGESSSTTVTRSFTVTNQLATGFTAISVVEGSSASDPTHWMFLGYGELDEVV